MRNAGRGHEGSGLGGLEHRRRLALLSTIPCPIHWRSEALHEWAVFRDEIMTPEPNPAVGFYTSLVGWEGRRSLLFYADLFGGQAFGARHGTDRDVRPLRTERAPVGWHVHHACVDAAPPHWLLYVRVASLGRRLTRVRDGGGQVLNGPKEGPKDDWIAPCVDPQGAAFALHEPRA